jgi:hypothetical protein
MITHNRAAWWLLHHQVMHSRALCCWYGYIWGTGQGIAVVSHVLSVPAQEMMMMHDDDDDDDNDNNDDDTDDDDDDDDDDVARAHHKGAPRRQPHLTSQQAHPASGVPFMNGRRQWQLG